MLLPKRNQKELAEGPEEIQRDLEVLFVQRMDEILPLALEEAAATGAAEVCSACPFCLTMLGDAIKETDRGEQLAAIDIRRHIVPDQRLRVDLRDMALGAEMPAAGGSGNRQRRQGPSPGRTGSTIPDVAITPP